MISMHQIEQESTTRGTQSFIEHARSRGFFRAPTPTNVSPDFIVRKLATLNHGVTLQELTQVCSVIEQKLPQWKEEGKATFLKLSDLPRITLQFDPGTQNTYIHINGTRLLGAGGSKHVFPSILYAPPSLVAHAVAEVEPNDGTNSSDDDEDGCEKDQIRDSKFLRELNGLDGIVQTHTISPPRKQEDGSITYAWIQKLYNGDTLAHNPKIHKCSWKQRIDITIDLIQGLQNMHVRGICHGDLSLKQCLIHFEFTDNAAEEQKAFAAITDFGTSYRPSEKGKRASSSSSGSSPSDSSGSKSASSSSASSDSDKDEVEVLNVAAQAANPAKNPAEELAVRARLEKEYAKDIPGKPFAKAFKAEVNTLGAMLYKFIFNIECDLYQDLSCQQHRHQLEDRVDSLSFEEKVQLILLKMMSLSNSHGYTLQEALYALRALPESAS